MLLNTFLIILLNSTDGSPPGLLTYTAVKLVSSEAEPPGLLS